MKSADILALLRPAQWIKNSFVFAALVFSLRLTDAGAVVSACLAFVVFCAASSAAYAWNDALDADRDALHPDKCDRPIAAGRIGKGEARSISGALVVTALAGSLYLGPAFLACTVSYLALQLAYTQVLKHVAVADVVAVASGFVLRTLAGVVAVGARMSVWLFFVTFLLALLLVVAKRRHELVGLAGSAAQHRGVLDVYSRQGLDAATFVLAAAVVLVYAGYTLSPNVAARLGTGQLYLTVPFVVFGIFRYLSLTYGHDAGGNPTDVLLGDRPLQATVAAWATTVLALIYGWPL